jgi:hypothetical protein
MKNDLETKINNLEVRVNKLESIILDENSIFKSKTKKIILPKELVRAKRPKNNYQLLAVIGFYLENIKNKEEFNREDLLNTWRETREPLPKDSKFNTDVNNTQNLYKYFGKGSKKGLYIMTNKGIETVESLPELKE